MSNKDIVISQEAFDKASEDLEALSKRLEKLREDVEEMLSLLQKGFDTPAGRLLLESSSKHLLEPLKDQQKVLKHISTTLGDSKEQYASIFEKYDELTKAIQNVGNI